MSKTAIFPGSFDPITTGHQAIIKRALPLFDKIIIALGVNSEKNNYFSKTQRINWLKDIYKKNKKIQVKEYKGLTVEFCKKEKAKYILRGLRDINEFQSEKKISQINNKLDNTIETIFIITPPELSCISSSIILDIIKNGGNVSKFLPKEVRL